MADFTNNLRLTELATGEGSGTWGDTTNLNLKAIADGLGYNTAAITGDTTFTIPDGRNSTATDNDKARSMYFALTSSGSLSGTKVITFAPNTISRVMLIENATTGTAITQIKQGSGGTVDIPNGKTKLVYMDGAGAGGKVIDISATLDLTGVNINGGSSITGTSLDINGNADISGDLTLSAGGDGALNFSTASSIKILDNSATALVIEEADNAYMTFVTTNSSEKVAFAKPIDVTGDVTATGADINGNAAITGTVTIDPPLVTDATLGLGAKGIIMKQGDLRMKVDGNYDATDGADVLGGSLQNNSRIIFDSEQHEHEQHETKGFRNPAFVIQANYNHNASNSTHTGHSAGEEYLDANISQLGLGNLTISSGKLQLRGKLEGADDGGTLDDTAGDDYIDHESFIGLSIDGDSTNGTLLNLHFGRINNSLQNIRLQPSAGGIIVEGMGTTGSPSTSKSNSGTIGTFNDEDLITLAQNQVTVAGELEATTLDINGAASIAGAITDVTTLTASSDIEVTDKTKGIILASPNGSRFRLEVANDGTLSTEAL